MSSRLAPDLAHIDAWTVALTDDQSSDVVRVADELTGAGHDLDSAPVITHPSGMPWVAAVDELLRSRGVARLTGFPVAALGPAVGMAFWHFASALGTPLPQGIRGERLDVVENLAQPTVRGSKTDRALIFHTDFANLRPDRFGLLVLRQAQSGGDTLLVSGTAAYDLLVREAPEHARTLRGQFWYDRTGDVGPDEPQVVRGPVFRHDGTTLSVMYNRARIHRGHRVAGQPLDPDQLAALDALDEVIARPALTATVRLGPGEALFIDNHTVLHSRTAFVDPPPPAAGRRLLRVWLRAGSRTP